MAATPNDLRPYRSESTMRSAGSALVVDTSEPTPFESMLADVFFAIT